VVAGAGPRALRTVLLRDSIRGGEAQAITCLRDLGTRRWRRTVRAHAGGL